MVASGVSWCPGCSEETLRVEAVYYDDGDPFAVKVCSVCLHGEVLPQNVASFEEVFDGEAEGDSGAEGDA